MTHLDSYFHKVERNPITKMGGGRDHRDCISDSSDETISKLSWSAEESNRTGVESVDPHFEQGSSLPWLSLSKVQVSGVLEVQNKTDENCEIDVSYQKAPKALLFMPVTGQVNNVQVRGKLEVQSEIVIDESCPETAKLLLSMPARGQLNMVQVSGELEIQNTIVTEESCPNSIRASIQTLPKDCIRKNLEVSNWTMKLKDADGSPESDSEVKNGDRADRVNKKSGTAEKQEFENHQENTSAFEDITLNQLPFLGGLEGHSREEHRRAEMRQKIIQKKAMREMRYDRIQYERERLLRYRPGAWLIETGGINRNHFDIPTITTLLLVGPKGAGKSTLINNILRVLSHGNERLDKAQVFYKSSAESGSLFLQEYMVPGTSKAFCMFDSRGLLENVAEDFPILENWMSNGIQHGEMVLRSSDDSTIRMFMKHKACDRLDNFSKRRKVNFVIFVVSAFSVLQIMENADTLASDTLAKLFNCPYLSFKDDKPVVVMTHGDELDDSDRIRAHVFLGELLGVSAVDQIFDISDVWNPAEDIALLDMLEHSLQRSEKNLPYRERGMADHFDFILKELSTAAKWTLKNVKLEEVVSFVILVVLAILVWLHFRNLNHRKQNKIDWHRIRHLWLG